MTDNAVIDIEESLEWEEWKPEENSFLCHMVAGSIAGLAEHTIMYPVDTLKTHVQCDRCGKIAKPGVSFGVDGCVYALKTIVRTEGVRRLWRGVSTMFAGCIPAHAAYFSIFEEAKRRSGAGGPGHHPLAAAGSGILATLAHDSIMGPMDTIKQRLQLGHYQGLSDCVRHMVRVEGVRGLFVSLPTTLGMNLPFGAIMVTANESFKTLMAGVPALTGPKGEHTVATHLLAGSGAGAIAAAATTPLDMIKTRLQTQHLPATHTTTMSGNTSPPVRGGGIGAGCSTKSPATSAPSNPPPTSFLGQQTRRVVTVSHHPGTGIAASVASSAASSARVSGKKAVAEASSEVARAAEHLGGFVDAGRAIHAEFGAAGFFRGMVPRLLVSAPSVAVSWTAYEYGKSLLKDKI